MAYEIKWSAAATGDLELISAYHRKAIVQALEYLRHEPTVETRNRKRLAEPIEGLPIPTWEVRVGHYRVLYSTEDERLVTILRVILKGSSTTEQAISRGKKR